MRLKLIPQNTNFDFFKRWKMWVGFSGLLMVLSLVLAIVMGLNFGIDFRGGTTIRTDSSTPVDVAGYRGALEPLGLGDISIAEVRDVQFAADQFVAQVRIQAQDGEEAVSNEVVQAVQSALGSAFGGALTVNVTGSETSAFDLNKLSDAFGDGAAINGNKATLSLPAGAKFTDVRDQIAGLLPEGDIGPTYSFDYEGFSFPAIDSVGPKVSGELIQSAVFAVLAALFVVLVYIWLRFEWQFAVGAVAALFHDVLITIGVFSLLQIKFDLAIIAALLTIVGYSLNDTVVVFDRVRENLRRYKKKDLAEVLNLSINETLSRTFMTSVTTLLALISLYVLGGDVIRGFVFAMILGVIIGTYSSIFIATASLLWLGVKRDWSKPDANEGNQFAGIDA